MLIFFYMAMFAVASLVILNGNGDFLSLAFDSGGVTTGPITVPFIMSLGVGVAATVGGRNANENSFGLIALCSIGPILAILFLGIGIDGNITYEVPNYSISDNLLSTIIHELLMKSKEVLIALGLIVIFFLIIQFIFIKLPKKRLIKLSIGILYTFLGLVIFLSSVTVGFMPIGYKLGLEIAQNNKVLIAVFGFVIGKNIK